MAGWGRQMPWGEFKLSELRLDQQNVRTGPQPDQRAALHALITDQGNKLVNLALDLLDYGPSPGEPIWVTADPSAVGQYIMLEGNRRVASFKMLETPSLAADTEVATAFERMAKDFATKPRRKLEAQVFGSREDAVPWIQRRHMSAASGVGLQRWRTLAKERLRADSAGRLSRSILVLDYLDDDTDEFGDVGDVINAKATTVDRVLNAPAMRDALGVNIDRTARTVTFENGDEIAGRRLLRDPRQPDGFKEPYVVEDGGLSNGTIGTTREYAFEGVQEEPRAWVDWVVRATSFEFIVEDVAAEPS